MLPTFPEFAALKLEDKDMYNGLVAEYPPFADISFTNLHIWWNLDGNLLVATLNGNLVINYSLPFDKEHSGLGLIGKNMIDESIQSIFGYLRHNQRAVRLVNVPEFTVNEIKDKQSLEIQEEPDFHEYIMSSKALAALEGGDHSRTRRKVNRFVRETENRQLELRVLDLSSQEVKDMISRTIEEWSNKYPPGNDPERVEEESLKRTLLHSSPLGTKNLCLYIDGKLHGVVLYHETIDHKHYILNHMRVDYGLPHIYDYLTNQVAIAAEANNIPFLNMEMDLGMEGLKRHKVGLRPVAFFKKYTVKPLGG